MLALLLLGGLAAGESQAQADRASREREQLRRVQAALQQAQQQVQQAQAREAEWALERAEHEQQRGRLEQQVAGLRAELARQAAVLQDRDKAAREQRERDDAQRAALQQRHDQDLTQAREQAAEAARVAALERERLLRLLDERTQANAALAVILEGATARAEDARQRNQRLHLLAHEALVRWRDKTAAEAEAQREPLFGIAAVRLEDELEQMRLRIDRERVPSGR